MERVNEGGIYNDDNKIEYLNDKRLNTINTTQLTTHSNINNDIKSVSNDKEILEVESEYNWIDPTNIKKFPYCMIGLVEVKIKLNNNYMKYYSTGTLVLPNLILVNTHSLFPLLKNGNRYQTKANEIYFTLGYNSNKYTAVEDNEQMKDDDYEDNDEDIDTSTVQGKEILNSENFLITENKLKQLLKNSKNNTIYNSIKNSIINKDLIGLVGSLEKNCSNEKELKSSLSLIKKIEEIKNQIVKNDYCFVLLENNIKRSYIKFDYYDSIVRMLLNEENLNKKLKSINNNSCEGLDNKGKDLFMLIGYSCFAYTKKFSVYSENDYQYNNVYSDLNLNESEILMVNNVGGELFQTSEGNLAYNSYVYPMSEGGPIFLVRKLDNLENGNKNNLLNDSILKEGESSLKNNNNKHSNKDDDIDSKYNSNIKKKYSSNFEVINLLGLHSNILNRDLYDSKHTESSIPYAKIGCKINYTDVKQILTKAEYEFQKQSGCIFEYPIKGKTGAEQLLEHLIHKYDELHYNRLKYFDFSNINFTESGIINLTEVFKTHSFSKKIIKLDFSNNDLEENGINTLTKGLIKSNTEYNNLNSISELNISNNNICPKGCYYFSDFLFNIKCANIKILNLSNNSIAYDGCQKLCWALKSIKAGNLSKIDLSKNFLENDGLKQIIYLIRDLKLLKLEELIIKDNEITSFDCFNEYFNLHIYAVKKNKVLESKSSRNDTNPNDINADNEFKTKKTTSSLLNKKFVGKKDFENYVTNHTKLRIIDISNSTYSNSFLASYLVGIKKLSLSELNFSNLEVGEGGALILNKYIKDFSNTALKNLKILNLNDCCLGDKGVGLIVDAFVDVFDEESDSYKKRVVNDLNDFCCLEELYLSNNDLKNLSVEEIFYLLKNDILKKLRILDISNNNFNKELGSYIVSSLKRKKLGELKIINLDDNEFIYPEEIEDIRKLLELN